MDTGQSDFTDPPSTVKYIIGSPSSSRRDIGVLETKPSRLDTGSKPWAGTGPGKRKLSRRATISRTLFRHVAALYAAGDTRDAIYY